MRNFYYYFLAFGYWAVAAAMYLTVLDVVYKISPIHAYLLVVLYFTTKAIRYSFTNLLSSLVEEKTKELIEKDLNVNEGN